MEKQVDSKSLLTIKVLRLLKPTLVGPLALASDPHDLSGDLWEKELNADITAIPGIPALSLGNFLRLPQGFGNMYLGELFSSYVVVQNESQLLVTDASCKVELQTQTQKFVLANKKVLEDMKFGTTIDIVMHHEIKEMGKHMLIVTLQYSVPSIVPSEPVIIERYFKFQVKKPLDVKTKLYNAESDEVYLEAQVQNITSSPICLEKVDLEPSASFTCVPLNEPWDSLIHRDEVSNLNVFQRSGPTWPNKMLDQDDSFQFLYRLTPKVEHARSAMSIGKLDITWRTALGDRGRLQTSQLQRQPPVLNDLKLVVTQIPDICPVDTPFELILKLSNTTLDRKLDLQVDVEDTPDSFCWLGITKYKLEPLQPSTSAEAKFSIFPIRTGLINISGIRITDGSKGEKFLFNDIAQVFILPANDNVIREQDTQNQV